MSFLLSVTLCYDKLCTRATLSVSSLVALCSFSRPIILMAEWTCRWKPFWIPIGDTFQKAFLEEWQLVDDGSKRDPAEDNLQASPNTTESAKSLGSGSNDVTSKQEKPWGTSSAPKSSWQAVGEPDAPVWEALRNSGYFGLLGKTGGTIASPGTRVQFYSPTAA